VYLHGLSAINMVLAKSEMANAVSFFFCARVMLGSYYNGFMNRLKEIAEQIETQSLPPVHLWKPEHEGDIDVRIDVNGFWFHEGDSIAREKLVRLFASILWYENGQHYLVTPAEKLAVVVEDVPFIIHQMEFVDGVWVVVTNTHESIIVGQDHPVELREYKGQWVPYIKVRYDLWARVNRSLFFQWVDLALEQQFDPDSALTLSSNGYTFEVAR